MSTMALWGLESKKISVFFFILSFSFDEHVICNRHFIIRKKKKGHEGK